MAATSFALASDTLVGTVRSFSSFSAAARQNADSRLYGGIHWGFDNERGLELGRALGNYVADNLLALNPTTDPGGEGGAGGESGGAGGEDTGGESGASGSAGESAGGTETGGRGGTTPTGGSSGTAGEGGEGATTTGGSSGNGTGGSDAGEGGTSSKPKPVEDDSGCDCRTTGKRGDERALALAGLGLLIALRRRSRRQ